MAWRERTHGAVALGLALLGASACASDPDARALSRWSNRGIARLRRITDPRPVLADEMRRGRTAIDGATGFVGATAERSGQLARSVQQALDAGLQTEVRRASSGLGIAEGLAADAVEDTGHLLGRRSLPWTTEPLSVSVGQRIRRLKNLPYTLGLEGAILEHPEDPSRYTGAGDPPPAPSLFTRVLIRVPL